jgi:hypothetical protein
MKHIQIETPRGKVVLLNNGKAELVWSTNAFKKKWYKRYTAAQKFVDSEVLRLSEPYTPLLTGTLIKTGILGTDIGGGVVSWIAPYAKKQYYKGRSPGLSNTGFKRGRYWFERMKESNEEKIIRGAERIAKGNR